MANVTVARRTGEEIKAGFPHDLKKQGILFGDWQKDQNIKPKSNGKPKTAGVVRRTKEETEWKFPLALKKKGVDFEKWKEKEMAVPIPAKAPTPKVEAYLKEVEQPKVLIEAPKELKQPPKPPKVEYVKVIERVIIETKDNTKELRQLIAEVADQVTWDTKLIPIDSKFKTTMMTELGKQGWKFCYIFDPRIVDPKSKKPDIMTFQRAKRKK